MNVLGPRKFDNQSLLANLNALMDSIARKKPESIKGKYFEKVKVKTSMGPAINLDIAPFAAMVKVDT